MFKPNWPTEYGRLTSAATEEQKAHILFEVKSDHTVAYFNPDALPDPDDPLPDRETFRIFSALLRECGLTDVVGPCWVRESGEYAATFCPLQAKLWSIQEHTVVKHERPMLPLWVRAAVYTLQQALDPKAPHNERSIRALIKAVDHAED